MIKARALRLYIHDEIFGYLIGTNDGRNTLYFDASYRDNSSRKTLSLLTLHNKEWMNEPKSSAFVLNPLLSNLLPEGGLRELVCNKLKISSNNEFELLCALGEDLPGAITAKEIVLGELPKYLQQQYQNVSSEISKFDDFYRNKFSLAGVQMKYSMIERSGRFTLSNESSLGNWIVKTPSSLYQDVPANEYTCMRLAEFVGVDIPEIKLIETDKIEILDNIKLSAEKYAFAIKRFDRRDESSRVHIEDFAQILYLPPHKKYGYANYTNIGKLLYNFSSKPLEDIQQYMKRLLVNVLLGNGDAHLKNWSMIYPDNYNPRLSPAYDIVSTIDYIANDSLALNFAKNKKFSDINLESFEYISKKIGVPFKAISHQLLDVIDVARNYYSKELDNLPMNENQKTKLKKHWASLHKDFRF
ncbi:type II toxin-antitoxin system HipA family toxin [Francisella philomiragia]|uniref:type II toxin-antitoxin system HipA family toxin n=1 Tax=Francisella philomiragia TaxID=28110 RepID=UPI001FD2C0C5|nr:type II toxin-antitoxin system HipA family toxin [Francisella philomiragia]